MNLSSDIGLFTGASPCERRRSLTAAIVQRAQGLGERALQPGSGCG
jgi:hypothetical protein